MTSRANTISHCGVGDVSCVCLACMPTGVMSSVVSAAALSPLSTHHRIKSQRAVQSRRRRDL